MQRIADLARTGHTLYIDGVIERSKAAAFAAKINANYCTEESRLQASRRRKSGLAAFRLMFYFCEKNDTLHWVLMRTEGAAPEVASRENWVNSSKTYIKLTGYELVRLPRKKSKTASYTWRYEKDQEALLREEILRLVRAKNEKELADLVSVIYKTPGFAGARAQVKKMRELLEKECQRRSVPAPDFPERLGYVRRLPSVGMKLSEIGSLKRGYRESK